jgi:hypothetical protein
MSEQNTQENEWAKREIGALWVKESPSQKYFSGHFTDQDGSRVKVVIFTNKHKKKETHPDYRVYKSTDPQSQNNNQQEVAVQPVETAASAVEEELI